VARAAPVTLAVAADGVCPPGPPEQGWVVLDGPVIAEVGRGRPPRRALDLGDSLLVPGLVDLQVNGVGDVDFAATDEDGWRRAGDALLGCGTTGYCPTLVTAPLDAYATALERVAAVRATRAAGRPQVLGVHLEGPFLGGAPGAHPIALIRLADAGWLGDLLDAHPGLVAMVTLAPEADPGLAATRALTARGVVVALGHSTASYADALAAADAGATVVTHLFNGMAAFHHREPGLVGAALDDDRLTPTLIADLVHVHPAALRTAIARKRSVALVTDAVAAGAGTVGGLRVAQRDGATRLPDGTLAGSTLSMDRAVRNVVSLGVPVERAIEMASTIPAEVLGLAGRGRLAPGARADVVALDRSSLTVRAVWLGGELAYGGVPSA
jgi:N-acetylglucosamine-6-phosphate deacetylase